VAKELYERKDTGLLRGVSLPFFGFSPWLQKLVSEKLVEAYSWPMGLRTGSEKSRLDAQA